MHDLGTVDRKLERHRGATRVAGDVCATHAKVAKEGGGVVRVIGDAHRRRCVRRGSDGR